MAEKLEDRHLADLHALAGELEVPSFRKLGRAELVAAIRDQGGEGLDSSSADSKGPDSSSAESESADAASARDIASSRDSESSGSDSRSRSRSSGRRRGGRGRRRGGATEKPSEKSRDSEPREAEDEEDLADEGTEAVEGVLDVMPRRYGFLRLSGLESADGDVYISASQIRRCGLKSGDRVAGPARKPRRGERHPALVHVDTVNGVALTDSERDQFEDLTPVSPTRRLELGSPASGSKEGDMLLRAVDLLCPLGLGQRVLVRAGARSGRSTLLRGLANALGEKTPVSDEPIVTIVVLIDERPEEATRWRDEVEGAELAIATADMRPGEQVANVELALARAKRLVESGSDVVLIVDSLSRLAVAHDDAAPIKRLFGAGRETKEDEAGSLTVIATLLEGDEDGDGPLRAVSSTESAVIHLDTELADAGVFPSLDVGATRPGGEAELRDADELKAARELRKRLVALDPPDAARELAELIESSSTNAELLSRL